MQPHHRTGKVFVNIWNNSKYNYSCGALEAHRVEELSHTGKTVKFRPTNPTKFAANASVLVESARAARM